MYSKKLMFPALLRSLLTQRIRVAQALLAGAPKNIKRTYLFVFINWKSSPILIFDEKIWNIIFIIITYSNCGITFTLVKSNIPNGFVIFPIKSYDVTIERRNNNSIPKKTTRSLLYWLVFTIQCCSLETDH